MRQTLPEAIHQSQTQKIATSVPLAPAQMRLIELLNNFATHQAEFDMEVRLLPAKLLYKANDELKLALIALLTTCALLDPTRNGNEERVYLESQLKIIQKDEMHKWIDFGKIRPELVVQSLIPEVIDDWILYRDVNGDGIHALMDRKTYLQGLEKYARGGHPVYEFARFYRAYMQDKMAKKLNEQERFKELAFKSLTEQMIQNQLQSGRSANDLLADLMNGDMNKLFEAESDETEPLKLTKK